MRSSDSRMNKQMSETRCGGFPGRLAAGRRLFIRCGALIDLRPTVVPSRQVVTGQPRRRSVPGSAALILPWCMSPRLSAGRILAGVSERVAYNDEPGDRRYSAAAAAGPAGKSLSQTLTKERVFTGRRHS